MTNEEARAYFIDSNERTISVAKDENGYNYETQQIENVFMRRDFEAKELAIQALEQEPKTGHWMKSNIGGAKVCSVCNAHMGLSSFKFCPNCGAKMVEPQESEEI